LPAFNPLGFFFDFIDRATDDEDYPFIVDVEERLASQGAD